MNWDSKPDEGRRSGEDRRKSQLPFDGPDRRKGERRQGERRTSPRQEY